MDRTFVGRYFQVHFHYTLFLFTDNTAKNIVPSVQRNTFISFGRTDVVHLVRHKIPECHLGNERTEKEMLEQIHCNARQKNKQTIYVIQM